MVIKNGKNFIVLYDTGVLVISDDEEMAAIELNHSEAKKLAEALLAYANTADSIMDDLGG